MRIQHRIAKNIDSYIQRHLPREASPPGSSANSKDFVELQRAAGHDARGELYSARDLEKAYGKLEKFVEFEKKLPVTALNTVAKYLSDSEDLAYAGVMLGVSVAVGLLSAPITGVVVGAVALLGANERLENSYHSVKAENQSTAKLVQSRKAIINKTLLAESPAPK